jgi:hypothetical protein
MNAESLPARERNQWWLVGATALAVFMASVDMSIVNIALPAIERDFTIPTSTTEWVVLAYLLPLAGLALPSGRWSDSVGRRQAFAFSLTGFAVASVAAGLAPSLAVLIGLAIYHGLFAIVVDADIEGGLSALVGAAAVGLALAAGVTLGEYLGRPVSGARDRYDERVRRRAMTADWGLPLDVTPVTVQGRAGPHAPTSDRGSPSGDGLGAVSDPWVGRVRRCASGRAPPRGRCGSSRRPGREPSPRCRRRCRPGSYRHPERR